MPRRIPVSEVPPGECRTLDVDGTMVAVFNVNGQFYAMDGCCPHAGGPLGDGFMNGSLVTCPWHGWQFDVTTGACTFSPDIKQAMCSVRMDGHEVEIGPPQD